MPVFNPPAEEFSTHNVIDEFFIPENHQMIVHQQVILEDQLTLEGDLVLIN